MSRRLVQVVTAVESASGWEEAKKWDGLLVADVYGKWFGPCSAMDRVFRNLSIKLANESIKFVSINAQLAPDLADYAGASEPKFLFYKYGVLFDIVHGARASDVSKLVTKFQPLTGADDIIPSPMNDSAPSSTSAPAPSTSADSPSILADAPDGQGQGQDQDEAAAATAIQRAFRRRMKNRANSQATPAPTPSTTAKPTPSTTAEPTPSTTAEPTPATTAEPTPSTTAEPTPATTAEPEPSPRALARAKLTSATLVLGLSAKDALKSASSSADSSDDGFDNVANDPVVVHSVTDGSPADIAGIRKGDFIVGVGIKKIKSKKHLGISVRKRVPGMSELFTLRRAGEKIKVEVVYGAKEYSQDELTDLARAAGGQDWFNDVVARAVVTTPAKSKKSKSKSKSKKK